MRNTRTFVDDAAPRLVAMKVTVAQLGRAHGLAGEISVDVRTDIPERRFVVGAVFETEPASAGPLTVKRVRSQGARWWIHFAELNDRNGAEAARGVELIAEAEDEDDAWYLHQLLGLRVERPDGSLVGEVADLIEKPAHDLLEVIEPSGHRALIPFVEDFVPVVDIEAGKVVVTPPYGLLAGEEPENTGETAGGDGGGGD